MKNAKLFVQQAIIILATCSCQNMEPIQVDGRVPSDKLDFLVAAILFDEFSRSDELGLSDKQKRDYKKISQRSYRQFNRLRATPLEVDPRGDKLNSWIRYLDYFVSILPKADAHLFGDAVVSMEKELRDHLSFMHEHWKHAYQSVNESDTK